MRLEPGNPMECTHHKSLREIFSQIVPFDQVELDLAYQYFSFQTYKPKDYIFSCGDIVHDVHFIIDGIGRYFYIDKEGNERNKSLVRKGGAFSCVNSLVEGSPSPFFTQAITQCTIGSIAYERLITLSKSNCNWGDFLRKVFERLVLKKEKREAGFLLLSAKERYEQFLVEFGEESRLIPLRHIAMYIGVTDVTLSRIRREMDLT
ncbi:Crp/Fnr family transcriptional regulator [Motilimonas sp. E26]|uniref:Crp/Fnr family transcriptional regulator n=1 Tax=Motilimonas sp. E26 TaxID=2865674 RepID=UPI001E5E7B70|nr:Crp/Fnr family transcriptional regulator [Motilimonas sp. E26]MCE0557687.1 Crp/Fnr family transcriptional regulator [Motilimonas sp. E26]